MKSVTRSALLRSSILLSSLSAISAQDVCPGLVAFESPYLAVYPVSISTYIAANTVFNINGNGYITINNAPTNLETVITATSTVTSTVTSTATTTTTATAANTAVPSGVVTTIAEPFLLDGIPGSTSRLMRRQQSGTYLGASANTVQGSCTQAAAFFLTNGQLTFGGEFFSTTVGTSYALFEATSTIGSISSGFYSNNGILGWNNTNFDNGIARFCSTGSSFYAVFTGNYPSGCTPFIFNLELEAACSGYGSTTISGSTTASGTASVTASTNSTGAVTGPTSTASLSLTGSLSSSSATESTTGSTASASSSSSSPSDTSSASGSSTSTDTSSSASGSSASSTITPSVTLTGSLTITSSTSLTNSSAAVTTTNTANPTIPTDLPAGATPVVVSFSVPGLSKRQSGGTRYLKSDGTFTADKTMAAVLGLVNGSLYGGPEPYSTNPGTDNEVFAVYDDIGTITTLFELTNGLTWSNGNFSINTAGNAEFAIVSSTVYAAFNSLPAGATVVSPSASTLPTVIGESSTSSSAAATTVSASITSAGSSSSSTGSGSTTPASTTSGTGSTSSSTPVTTGSSSSSSIITSSSSSFTSSSAPYGNSTSSTFSSTSSSNSTMTV